METGQDPTIYNAFLRGITPAVIKRLLERVADGEPVYNSKLQRKALPRVICVARGNPRVQQQFDDCEKHPTAGAFISTNMQSYIFLCNGFLGGNLEPTSDDCSTLGDRRRTKLTSSAIQITQTSMLLHELLHLYLGPDRVENEMYEINEAMALPLSERLINVANYVYFVGSESFLIVARRRTFTNNYRLLGVIAGCDDFPKRYQSPNEEF